MAVTSHQQIRILHVDDDPKFTELTGMYLEREDDRFTVETATSADEGLQRIGDRPPECVVSDYNMPGRDGLEFLDAVRAEYPDLPFVLFTGKGSEAVASDAISAGVTDYLQKQGGTEQYELLANRIRNAVGARRESRRADRQEQLMRLTEFAGDTGGWELDRETGTVLLTAGTRRIIGRPDQSEIQLEEAIELFHPDDRTTIYQTLRRAFETGDEIHTSWRLQPEDSEERLLEITITPVVENGEVTKLRGAGHDITERKQRARELERERERLDTVVSKIPVVVFALDSEGVFTLSQGKGLEALGLEPGEVVGQSVFDVYESQEPLLSDIERALDGENVTATHEVEGQVFESALEPAFDEDGSVRAVNGVSFDITERREREHDLEQTTEWYQSLLDAAPDAIFVADAETGLIRETNRAATRLLDRPRDEIVGMHQTELHPTEKAEEYADLFREHVTAGEGRDETLGEQVDIYVVDSDGDEIPVEINAQTVEIDGEHFNQGYFRDITDRKQRERELQRQNERLDEFVSVVSHDLQNPLYTLSGSLGLLETEDEEHRERCRRSVDRMERLLDDLLTLARHGETDSEDAPVDLAVVARESAQTTVQPEVQISLETGATVVAERARLKQLFENLFSNAVEHNGPDVSITVGDIDDGFYVEDDGSGIPEDERETIFEIGYSTSEDGTGFGLNIVKQVVAAHGWDIRATDGQQGGARFEITGVDVVE